MQPLLMPLSRKKVLLFIPSLQFGGAERFFSLLLQHLARDSFEPHLVLLKACGEYMEEIPDDVVVHDLGVTRARYAVLKLVRLIRGLRPHAVLSTVGSANIALMFARPFIPRNTRVLLSESTSSSACLEAEASHPRVWKWLYRMFYKRADRVICLSDAITDEMAQLFNVPREKLRRIYYPVDIKRVRERAETGENPFLDPGPQLVAAGRLCPAKGFDVLLDAMPAVLQKLPTARLTILGEGELRAELTEQARKLGLERAISLAGFQSNPWRYFRYADLFVLSSRYEGLPNVLLEAFALNTPVVATECSGAIRELAAFYGKMIIVPPEDPAALSSAMVSACAGSGFTGARDDLSTFSLERVVGEYSSLLSE